MCSSHAALDEPFFAMASIAAMPAAQDNGWPQ
jgi:hypothetical protein